MTARGGRAALVFALLAACDAATDGRSDRHGPGPGGGVCDTPAVCETALCGAQVDAECGAVDCGRCRWSAEPIGSRPTITTGPDGMLHLLFVEYPAGTADLTYASLDAAGVLARDVITAINGSLTRAPELAVAPDGTLHVVWASVGAGVDAEVWHAVRNAGWTIESLGVGYAPDVAVDSAGRAHVLYQSAADPSPMRAATRESTGWRDVVLDSGNSQWPSVAIGADGAPHAAYFGFSGTFILRFVTLSGTTWQLGVVPDAQVFFYEGNSLDLAFDAAGEPWILGALANPGVRLFRRAAGVWSSETLSADFASGIASLGFGGAGNGPHVLYYDGDGLLYAKRSGDAWTDRRRITEECDAGQTDLAVAGDGKPHLVFDCRGMWHSTVIAAYSASYEASCDAVVARVCPAACACYPGSDCAYHTDTFSSTFGPEGYCPTWARGDLCASDTIDPALIGDCEAALQAGEGACEADSWRFPDACGVVVSANRN